MYGLVRGRFPTQMAFLIGGVNWMWTGDCPYIFDALLLNLSHLGVKPSGDPELLLEQ